MVRGAVISLLIYNVWLTGIDMKHGPYPRRGIIEKRAKPQPTEESMPKPKKTAGPQHLYSKRSTAKAKSLVTLPSLPWGKS